MSYLEVRHADQLGWLCDNDLLLVCEKSTDDDNEERTRRQRFVPQLNFNDQKWFPVQRRRPQRSSRTADDEVLSELSSLLAGREYVSEQNHHFDRKLFQQAQAAQASEEKKLHELQRRQQQHSSHLPTARKRPSKFND